MKEEQDSNRKMSAQAVVSYFRLVMVELYRLLEQQLQAEHFREPDGRFLAFMEWVEVLYREVKSITVYADKVHLSPRQLSRICLDITGKTANQLLNERVSLEAKRLLFNGQIQAKEVGYQLGFDDPSNFVKFFKRHNGVSPVGFRENMALTKPESTWRGRSICVISPVMINLAFLPIRVRNILICGIVVFWASSRITKALSSVRPRMDQDRRDGKTIVVKIWEMEGHNFSPNAFNEIIKWGLEELQKFKEANH